MQEQEGLPVESITFAQFAQSVAGQEVRGVPTGEIAYPVTQRERKPGQELAKHRVRVSFDFDVTCNSGPVANESYDEGGPMDMALLKSFLVADKGKLLDIMVDAIGTKLGMHSCETFMLEFLPQVNTEPRELFRPAIDQLSLEGDVKEYWIEVDEDEPDDTLNLCTESIFKCFTAEFVSSSYEIIGENND